MLISQIIKSKGSQIHSVPMDATLLEASGHLHANRVGCVLVLDEAGEMVGVLSERDVVREIAKRGAGCLETPVSQVMSRNVVTVEPDETVDACLARMTDRRIRHLPVQRDGRLVGLVSIGDLVARKIEEVEVEVASMRAYIASG